MKIIYLKDYIYDINGKKPIFQMIIKKKQQKKK